MSLTREVTRHVRNARGGPLISVFGVVCSLGESDDVTWELHASILLLAGCAKLSWANCQQKETSTKRGGLLLGYNFVCEPFSVSGYSMFDSIFLFCGSGGSGWTWRT